MGRLESFVTLILVFAIFLMMGGCSKKSFETPTNYDGIQTISDKENGDGSQAKTTTDITPPRGLTFDLLPYDSWADNTVLPRSEHYMSYDPGELGDGVVVTWVASDGYFTSENGKTGKSIITDLNDPVVWTAPDADGPVDYGVRATGPEGDGEVRASVAVDSDAKQGSSLQPYYTPLLLDDGNGRQIEIAAGELLVKFREGTPLRSAASVFNAEKIHPLARVAVGDDSFYRVWINPDDDIAEAKDKLNMRREVEYAEFNYICHLAFTPNDPFYNQKWDLTRMNAPSAWDICDGSTGVIVAVIDTGVDLDHPDLANRIMDGADFVPGGDDHGGEVPGDGIDNNFDGWVDGNVGHGSHVAGIIGAQGNNGIGTVGVNLEVTIMPLRVFPVDGDGGAMVSSICSAIDYAATHGADVINMSLGSPSYSSTFHATVLAAVEDGVTVVCAAGNSGVQTEFYPAAYEEAIAVASIDSDDEKSSFSNYGTWVDICAPGASIHSTFFDNTYAFCSGTSMASPEVAGVAALIRGMRFDFGEAEVRATLLDGADAGVYDANPSYSGKLGSGCADAYSSLMLCSSNPNKAKLIDLGTDSIQKADPSEIRKAR